MNERLAAGQELRELRQTYRYLRMGIVAAVVVLFAALIEERVNTGCLKGSISSYFYSPVRSVFVGGLIAIGLCLVAIHGRSNAEEVLLNLAGMFAPVVALVPTTPSDECPSTVDGALLMFGADGGDTLPDWVMRGIRNNMIAYLAVAAAVMLALLVWYVLAGRRGVERSGSWANWLIGSLVLYAVLIGAGIYLYLEFTGFQTHSHWASAVAMFACFFGVVLINWWRFRRARPYGATYAAIWIGMAVAALAISAVALGSTLDWWDEWAQSTYWLEVCEIALFAAFWMVQTAQWWGREEAARRPSAAGQAAGG